MLKRREGGQALVEFALVAPVFFLILFGIIQLGLVFAGQNGLTNGVRETARYAVPYRVVDSSGASTTCSIVLSKLTDILGGEVIGYSPVNEIPSVTYTWKQDVNGSWYVSVKVKVDYKFPLFVPIVANILDGADGVNDSKLRMSAQEEMRVENDPLSSSSATVSCP